MSKDDRLIYLVFTAQQKLRILATAGTARKRPDIPTFKEEGFPQIEGVGWNAIVVPAKFISSGEAQATGCSRRAYFAAT